MRRPIAGLALALGLACCADPRATGTPTPTPSPTPGGLCDGVTAVPGLNLALRAVATGLDRPLFVTAPPGDTDRLFVVEQARAGPHRRATACSSPTPFLDISAPGRAAAASAASSALAFHPDFATQRPLLRPLHRRRGGDIRIAEFRASGEPRRAPTPRASACCCTIDAPAFANHNGGMLAFGPDGYLYVGIGDGGGAGDPLTTAQDAAALLGKMLRLDVDAPAGTRPAGQPVRRRPEVWAYGLRNPWRFSFDRATGDLYIGDVGQNALRGDRRPAGRGPRRGVNYGWSVDGGPRTASTHDRRCSQPRLHPAGRSSTAHARRLLGHRRLRLPRLRAPRPRRPYLYGDYCAGFIRAIRVAGEVVTEERDLTATLGAVPELASFGEDARGEVYVVSLAGSVFRIVAR